jgi:hypothetical protein
MHQMEKKQLLIERILPYLIGAPADAVQRLLQQSLSDLETILSDCITKRARAQAVEQVKQHADDMRRESRLEGAWTHALRNVWLNGKQRLVDVDSNGQMMESLIQAHETPSASLYGTIALTYPKKVSWEIPQAQPTKEDQRAAFDAFVRDNNLSSCEANVQLFKQGASTESFAGASQIERAQYAHEAAQARQKFLIHDAICGCRRVLRYLLIRQRVA